MEKVGRAPVSRNIIFLFVYISSEVEQKLTPSLPNNMKLSGLLSNFILLVEKVWDKRVSINWSGDSS